MSDSGTGTGTGPRGRASMLVAALGVLQLVTAGIMATGAGALWVALFLAVVGLALAAATLRLLRGRVSGGHPVMEVLRPATAETADLTTAIPAAGADAMTALFRQFFERLKATLEELQRHNLAIALSSEYGRSVASKANRNAAQQEEYSELIFQSSEQTATALDEISSMTNSITNANSENLKAAQTSLAELTRANDRIGDVTSQLEDFQQNVGDLKGTSHRIEQILTTVQGFAAKTNLLALNAAIEASRAGEHGRGFAVVADEVRELAAKVRGAADEIGDLVDEMTGAVSRTADRTRGMIEGAGQAQSEVSGSRQQFAAMVERSEETQGELERVASAIEELTVTNREIHTRSTEIRELGLQIHQDMERSEGHSDRLRNATNDAVQVLSQFRTGRSELERAIVFAEQRRDELQARLEPLLDQGVDLFDRHYTHMPGTEPEQHDVSYARPMQRACQDLVDSWKGRLEGSPYCLPIDNYGYVATHLSEVSHPQTGDPKVDLMRSRNMRFFNNQTERERMKDADYLRLITYARDTGDIMFNLYVPVFLRGRHWGAIALGLTPKALGLAGE